MIGGFVIPRVETISLRTSHSLNNNVQHDWLYALFPVLIHYLLMMLVCFPLLYSRTWLQKLALFTIN